MSEFWWFDRLGENLDVPHLEVDPEKLGDLVRAIREHATKYTIVSPPYRLHGPAIQKRRLGGYDIVDATTGFTYGQARKSPTFTEKPDFGRRSLPVLPPMLMPPQGRYVNTGSTSAHRSYSETAQLQAPDLPTTEGVKP